MDTRTLVATFNDYNSAQQASRELQDSGVPESSINIDSNQKTMGAGSGGYQENENKESGFSSWWNSLFGSEDDDQDRKNYEGALQRGSTVLRATVSSATVDSAVAILNRYGAADVDQNGAGTARDYQAGTRTTTGTEATGREAVGRDANNGPIEVIEEELQVGKRAVRRGGVRVYSHLVSRPVEEQVTLREEHVNVQRRPVNREISPEEASQLHDQTIEVTEMTEEPVIAKRARVREEVVVGKEASERVETVRDNLRHTEVEVENIGEESNTPSDSTIRNTAGTAGSQGQNQVRATGLSPHPHNTNVMSGFGSTPGAGTLAGEGTTGRQTYDLANDYTKNFETPMGEDQTLHPGYEYGSRSASDVLHKGKTWAQAENDLRSDYERRNPGSRWEEVKDAVRSGWEKVSGQR